MTASFFATALLTWSIQICGIVLAGACAERLLRQRKLRLLFWQALLAIILALPFAEPWRSSPPLNLPAAGANHWTDLSAVTSGPVPHGHIWTAGACILLLGCGIATRILWICIGLWRLRKYRQEAFPLRPAPVPLAYLNVEWYLHPRLQGPVTFGWFRPSILLPRSFEELQPEMRQAIACHELVHVTRHDWLWVMCEELIRAIFWFHPCIWFLLSKIQLAREQVVDQEAIRLTKDSETYLDTLLAMQARTPGPDLAPAPLFLKRRQLAERVAAILQEVPMSPRRVYAAFAAAFSAVLTTALLCWLLIPFTAPAQVVNDDPGVSVETSTAVIHRAPVHMPEGVKTGGTVVVDASLNGRGEVTDARVVSGPNELRKPALASVLDWHFTAGTPAARVTIRFDAPDRDPNRLDGLPVFRTDPNPLLNAWPATLKSIEIKGLSSEAEQQLRSRLPVREGDIVQLDDVPGILRTIGEYDRHLRPTVQVWKNTFSLIIQMPSPSTVPAATDVPAGTSYPLTPGVPRIRVGGNAQAANIEYKVTPVYPFEAKQAAIEGQVRFTAIIGQDGTVKSLQLISGHPSLVDAAMDAVQQWRYRPVLLNGKPVEVVTNIDINFTLAP